MHGDLAEWIKRNDTDRLGDSVPEGSSPNFSRDFYGNERPWLLSRKTLSELITPLSLAGLSPFFKQDQRDVITLPWSHTFGQKSLDVSK